MLSLVPLIALALAIFTGFSAFSPAVESLQSTLLTYLLPTSKEVFEQYLNQFSQKAAELSTFGMLGLVVSALLLFKSIEDMFNDIWKVKEGRSLSTRFVTYWALLSLLPVLIIMSFSISSKITTLSWLQFILPEEVISYGVPWMMITIAFTLLYKGLPHTAVSIQSAVSGALVAALLFECSKLAFAWYIQEISWFNHVYGTLSALPIFMLWMYLVWVIVLLGAELTYYLQHQKKFQHLHNLGSPPQLSTFFYWLTLLEAKDYFERGEVMTSNQLVEQIFLNSEQCEFILQRLCEQQLLKKIADGYIITISHDEPYSNIEKRLQQCQAFIPPSWQQHPLAQQLHELTAVEHNDLCWSHIKRS